MTAAEILDKLLDDLGDLKCSRGHCGYEQHAKRCGACQVLDRVVEIYMKAEDARDTVWLIFGEAA